MRRMATVLIAVLSTAAMLAAAVPAYAIGFDAEREVYPSVFVVYSGNSIGSGFAIGENCLITNAHVLDGDHSVIVESYGGDRYEAKAVIEDETLDIAVLQVPDVSFPVLSVADSAGVKVGDDIYAIGAPSRMPYTLTKGAVSARERIIAGNTYIQIDAAINAGNSGGPLLNDRGEALGVNTLKMSGSEGIGLAIPISAVCRLLQNHGVTLDAAGNVSGAVDAPGYPAVVSAPPESAGAKSPSAPNLTVLVLGVSLGLSASVNIVLLILLLRKKRTRSKADPSERTDFEIELRN